MRDVFYTLMVVWIIWRIMNSVNSYKAKQAQTPKSEQRKQGETFVDYVPPKTNSKHDDTGEYVDYEEIK